MANKVFINEQDIIECKVIGDQTEASVQKMGQEIQELFPELKAQHQPLLILDDVTEIGQVPAPARAVVTSLAKDLPYDRLAMLGKSGLIRFGANLIIRASGRGHKLQYFTDRAQATTWLLEAQQSVL